jgi:hypothetical protein
MDKWVFVPGYYQGKAPWGIYVGKTAYTHYDFEVYEDYDRDYAFVAVYNGVKIGAGTPKKVTKSEFDKHTGIKDAKDIEISRSEFRACRLDPTSTEACWVKRGSKAEPTGPDFPGAEVAKVEVSAETYKKARFGEPVTENVTVPQAAAYIANQKKDAKKYPAKVAKDRRGNWTITHYFVQQWYKPGSDTKFYKTAFYIIEGHVKDAGRLGDNVGGQGFAWNQPTQKIVRVFGWPPDRTPTVTRTTPAPRRSGATARPRRSWWGRPPRRSRSTSRSSVR